MIPFELKDHPAEVQKHYLKMIEDGQSHNFALMCSLSQPPGTKGTERAFMEKRYNSEWLNDMPKFQADRMLREAKESGITTNGRYYHSGIADKRGWKDPEAWIEGSDDVVRVAKKRNLQVRGSVNVDAHEVEPTKKKFSKQTEDRIVKHYKKKNKKLSDKAAKELAHKNHLPNWKK